MTVAIIAKPLENDSAEIVMKIEKINEQLPGNEERWRGKSRKIFRSINFFSLNECKRCSDEAER